MAGGAILGEPRRQVIWLRRPLKLPAVTADTLHGCTCELSIRVALLAGGGGVLA